jgi:hypothetical protein
MGTIKNPKLFSKEFGIDPAELNKRKLLDPILNGDTRLFIDPILLTASKNPIIKTIGVAEFTKHFGNIIRLLKVSKTPGDAPWRAAEKILTLNELPELCLGYGGNTTRGRGLAKKTRQKVLATAKEIVDLGIDDPELFSLIGLLEDGVGPDTIGDMTAKAILPALIDITAQASKELGIKTKKAKVAGLTAKLPLNKIAKKSTILVPSDILRDLPVATDWSDISDAAHKNQEIRDRVNAMIGNIWKKTLKEQKKQIRVAALKDGKAFKTILDAAKLLRDSAYDFSADPDGHRIFREALETFATQYPLKLTKPKTKDGPSLRKIVNEIIDHFTQLVEKNEINYLLWYGNEPRKEKAAQRLFFAVADVYCKANNIDISPETDSGGGPVDFKFSSGYKGRVLVEIKLSTGQVEHGYNTQLGVYDDAAKSFESIFLIIDVGRIGNKLKKIVASKNKRATQNQRTPDIVVVDAKRKPSASKRRA